MYLQLIHKVNIENRRSAIATNMAGEYHVMYMPIDAIITNVYVKLPKVIRILGMSSTIPNFLVFFIFVFLYPLIFYLM